MLWQRNRKTVAKEKRDIIRKLPARIRHTLRNDPQSEEFTVIQNSQSQCYSYCVECAALDDTKCQCFWNGMKNKNTQSWLKPLRENRMKIISHIPGCAVNWTKIHGKIMIFGFSQIIIIYSMDSFNGFYSRRIWPVTTEHTFMQKSYIHLM